MMTKALKTISQILIGVVFIFSGFVKAVDPMGSVIKFNDYFNAMHLAFLSPMALYLAIALSAIEFLIGIHILLGIRPKITTWPLIVMMVFFTLVTFYSAYTNDVTDCGCFGDAIKLTNWETFFKNLVLLPFAAFLFYNRNKFTDTVPLKNVIILKAVFLLFIVGVSLYGLRYEPFIDFRPYHIGANITKLMEIPPGAEKPVYETTFILEKNGEKKEFTTENYPYTDSSWVYVDRATRLIKEGYTPPIHDFVLQSISGTDMTQNILNEAEPVFLLIAPKLEKAKIPDFIPYLQLHLYQHEWGHKFYLVTSSTPEEIKKFDLSHGTEFSYLVADETVLKTIVRSNPGLVLLDHGTVAGKWNGSLLKRADMFKDITAATTGQISQTKQWLIIGLASALLFCAILLLYKHK